MTSASIRSKCSTEAAEADAWASTWTRADDGFARRPRKKDVVHRERPRLWDRGWVFWGSGKEKDTFLSGFFKVTELDNLV